MRVTVIIRDNRVFIQILDWTQYQWLYIQKGWPTNGFYLWPANKCYFHAHYVILNKMEQSNFVWGNLTSSHNKNQRQKANDV